MYTEFYNLNARPFQLSPDPLFYFDTATHRKAMAYLGYGLAQGEGFLIVTGDVGVGKTTLVGHLMASIDRTRTIVGKIVTTHLDADNLLIAGDVKVSFDAISILLPRFLESRNSILRSVIRSPSMSHNHLR